MITDFRNDDAEFKCLDDVCNCNLFKRNPFQNYSSIYLFIFNEKFAEGRVTSKQKNEIHSPSSKKFVQKSQI